VPTERAEAGDIVAIAGLTDATVADTLCDLEVETALPANPIDPPTLPAVCTRIIGFPFESQPLPVGRPVAGTLRSRATIASLGVEEHH
jgi:predicted membrane GTPase involved in stress response